MYLFDPQSKDPSTALPIGRSAHIVPMSSGRETLNPRAALCNRERLYGYNHIMSLRGAQRRHLRRAALGAVQASNLMFHEAVRLPRASGARNPAKMRRGIDRRITYDRRCT
jgi:hypothetical protein